VRAGRERGSRDGGIESDESGEVGGCDEKIRVAKGVEKGSEGGSEWSGKGLEAKSIKGLDPTLGCGRKGHRHASLRSRQYHLVPPRTSISSAESLTPGSIYLPTGAPFHAFILAPLPLIHHLTPSLTLSPTTTTTIVSSNNQPPHPLRRASPIPTQSPLKTTAYPNALSHANPPTPSQAPRTNPLAAEIRMPGSNLVRLYSHP